MERTGWGHRIANLWLWKPSNHKQVWLSAVISGGVLVSVVMSVVFSAEGQRSWLAGGLIVGVGATFTNGVLGSLILNWRRNQGL